MYWAGLKDSVKNEIMREWDEIDSFGDLKSRAITIDDRL